MKHAFSLVELSIVLVILGLLTGGILAGQSLIRAAELRAVTSEYQRYTAARNTFRDKYFALPGDMATATSFWGTAGTCPGTYTTPSTSAATCNGDGNGQIYNNVSTSNENIRFWQHLANAGLIEGSYNGVAALGGAGSIAYVGGWNVPASKLSRGTWGVSVPGTYTYTDVAYFEGTYSNAFHFSVDGGTASGILKAEEAWNIDTKLDDGKPGTGTVVTREDSTSCHDGTPSSTVSIAGTANYKLTDTSLGCTLLFKAS